MKELVFALQFKGKARPVEGADGKLAAKTSAGGQVLRTAVTAKGIQVKSESKPGPRATFESEVQITGEGTFVESGRISYGKAGKVAGQFAGATGLITSNFTVGAKGEVVDNHYVRLYLPDQRKS